MSSVRLASLKEFPEISTVFDQKDAPHFVHHNHNIRGMLLRILPAEIFYRDSHDAEALKADLQKSLPLIKCMEWGDSPYNFSLFLLTPHRYNAVKFFHEMISRWLLPGQRINIDSFFSANFTIPELGNTTYALAEAVISFDTASERDLARHFLPILESEIKIGLTSVYHANRILETKGLSSDEKTSLIQERISQLIDRRPRDFDYDIFSQMQHFLVTCGDEFKGIRSYEHMSRLIAVFYLFRKKMLQQVEQGGAQRHVLLKLSKAHLHLPLGLRHVLGVFVGVNLLSENEVFEERHLRRVLSTVFPQLRFVEDSYFAASIKEEKLQLLYLEVEKGDGSDVFLHEMAWLLKRLPSEIKNGVERLIRPIFMPRNEEEVMRNMIVLSQQLRFLKDLPQVILMFDEQTEAELSFTVILLRILHKEAQSVQDLFEHSDTKLRFIPERVKRVGYLRKKYPKEATVFKVRTELQPFLRPDQSVDLFQARRYLLGELQKILGEMRDYNGGMFAKQYEQFFNVKAQFPALTRQEEVLLESFFHAIFPIELRSFIDPLLVKTLFNLFLQLVDKKHERVLIKQEKDKLFFLLCYQNPIEKERAIQAVEQFSLSRAQLITVSMQAFEDYYLGYVYAEEDLEKQERFLNRLLTALDF